MQRGSRVGGRFEIVAPAGRGGMGTVFRARDVTTRRDVAIKTVAAGSAEDTVRFLREADILSRFRHPGIVGYIAHGPGFLAMEWVEGETLAHRLATAPLSTRETLGVLRQLAGALAALHDAEILHRDVKPANLMLAADHLKLVDFGIARGTAEPRMTRSGAQIGTAGYMAPEQARGERELTGRTDVFAFGCVMYECLAGVPAYRGDSALALRAKALLHDPTPLRQVAPGIAPGLDALVARLLAREPSQRPTAGQVVDELATIEGDAATPAVRRAQVARTEPAGTSAAVEPAGTSAAIGGDGRDPRPACAIMVSAEALPALAELTALPFTGGAVATRPDPASAAALGIALAAQLPLALIAIACGATPGDAIDRSAQIVDRLEIAAATGAQVAGVWMPGGVARQLGMRASAETHGGLVRLLELS